MAPHSSDRYIKAKFDNRAGTQIKIIPSKGQKKSEGYIVEPHMTLDLSFIEKGVFNNIPVTFRVVDPKTGTGKDLMLNGERKPFTVHPSVNKDKFQLATVTACKYKTENQNFVFSINCCISPAKYTLKHEWLKLKLTFSFYGCRIHNIDFLLFVCLFVCLSAT